MAYDPNNPYIFDEEGNAYSFRRTVERGNSCPDPTDETHTHEFLGSTRLAEEGDDRHNHRFAGVTTGEIPTQGGNHVHGFESNTDSVDHFHEIAGTTGPAIVLNPQAPVAMQKHIHLARGTTTEFDQHTYLYFCNPHSVTHFTAGELESKLIISVKSAAGDISLPALYPTHHLRYNYFKRL